MSSKVYKSDPHNLSSNQEGKVIEMNANMEKTTHNDRSNGQAIDWLSILLRLSRLAYFPSSMVIHDFIHRRMELLIS